MQSRNPDGEISTVPEITRPQAVLDVLLALLLVLAASLFAALLAPGLPSVPGAPAVVTPLLQGAVILAGLYWLLGRRGQGWRQIGFRRPQLVDVGRAGLALLAVFAVNASLALAVTYLLPHVMDAHQDRLSEVAQLLVGDLPLVVVAGTMLFVGFYEEALARGFLLRRCQILLKGVWAPVLISSMLFGLGHFYQGWFGVIQTTLVGIVFARLVIYWGTLWPVILAHAALNTIALLILRNL